MKKINAAQIPLINVNEPLVNASVVGYVGTNDVSLARETGRYLLKAMNGKRQCRDPRWAGQSLHRRGPRPRISRRHQGDSPT